MSCCCWGEGTLKTVDDGEINPALKTLGIIIAGAPASGKGTQCEYIKKEFGVVHLSTGDMLRAAVKEGSELGKKAEELMNSGKLVPDDIIIGAVRERLDQKDVKERGFLLDGFPRTEDQAKALAELGVDIDVFIMLEVPDEKLVARVVGRRIDPVTKNSYHVDFNPPPEGEIADRVIQRDDDTEEKVKVRLEGYHANISAIKSFYESSMVQVDGDRDKNQVWDEIQVALKSKQEL
uniref:Adenylate kinase active site lid domain-containing protein n=1 Tax=Ditylum brightwellii TaxID=49249 RepID=A0A6U3WS76_9STRA|mmetsp:Transcript_33253/g.49551  ORF Transcript_33253/g.49551 Transcript_33253/m.49551 type:complete len:235 (+) Transcript_33253:45-749(+)